MELWVQVTFDDELISIYDESDLDLWHIIFDLEKIYLYRWFLELCVKKKIFKKKFMISKSVCVDIVLP